MQPDSVSLRRPVERVDALTGGNRPDLIGATGERIDSVALPDGALPTNICLGRTPDELFVSASHLQALVRARR